MSLLTSLRLSWMLRLFAPTNASSTTSHFPASALHPGLQRATFATSPSSKLTSSIHSLPTPTAHPLTEAPSDWKSKAPFPLPGSTSFSQQHTLPSLPVPSLDATLSKLEKTLLPLARTPEELESVRAKIAELGKEDGFGKTLHERLLARANDPSIVSWLEEFWDDAAYLTYRDSVVINVSYYYGFVPHPEHLPQHPAHRAAAIARSALLFRKMVKQGKLSIDKTKEGALCMDSWRWMWDACRIPTTSGKDISISAGVEGDTGDSGSIVVLRKGRVWEINATTTSVDEDGKESVRLLSTDELERQIQHIYDNTTTDYPGVGYLPANDRDSWTTDYAALLAASPANSTALGAIQRASFVVSLETERPEGVYDFSRAAWHGGVTGDEMGNRWVDKPIQFIVWDNGKAAMMGEHSVMDGTPTTRMAGEVIEALKSPSFDHGPSTSASESSSIPSPTPYDFVLTPALHDSIAKARTHVKSLIASQSLTFLRTAYGKDAIKKMGYSPDSWTQMLIQLAYHRLLLLTSPQSSAGIEPIAGSSNARKIHRVGGTYEAASTRKYAHGRTETIRSYSVESEDFVHAVERWEAGEIGKEDVRVAFDKAVKEHGIYARGSGNGMGVDRHLFGLRKMLKSGEEAPALFSDPLYQRSNYWVVSTSAIHSPNFAVYGWGEVAPDGYGVGYVTGFDDFLQFTVTSRTESPNEEFSRQLNKAADDMRELFRKD